MKYLIQENNIKKIYEDYLNEHQVISYFPKIKEEISKKFDFEILKDDFQFLGENTLLTFDKKINSFKVVFFRLTYDYKTCCDDFERIKKTIIDKFDCGFFNDYLGTDKDYRESIYELFSSIEFCYEVKSYELNKLLNDDSNNFQLWKFSIFENELVLFEKYENDLNTINYENEISENDFFKEGELEPETIIKYNQFKGILKKTYSIIFLKSELVIDEYGLEDYVEYLNYNEFPKDDEIWNSFHRNYLIYFVFLNKFPFIINLQIQFIENSFYVRWLIKLKNDHLTSKLKFKKENYDLLNFKKTSVVIDWFEINENTKLSEIKELIDKCLNENLRTLYSFYDYLKQRELEIETEKNQQI